MRKISNIIHLWLGLITGCIVFIVAVTGVFYCFEEEARGILHKDLLYVTSPTGPRASIETLVSSAKTYLPDQPVKNVRIYSDGSRSIEVIFKNKESVFVDPHSAKVLGGYNKEEDFFGVCLKLHRTLYLGDTGKLITGTSALIFFFMLISGIILWWPKSNKFTSQKLTIKKQAGAKRRNYDLHSVLGFYASWILVFTAITGIIWSFKWAENSMYFLANSKKEEKAKLNSALDRKDKIVTPEDIYKSSISMTSVGKETFIIFPEDSASVYRVITRYDNNGFFKKSDQVFYDQYSGKILKEQLYGKSSLGDKIKATNYDIHTGKVLGFIGQLIVFFAGIIAASLPITGFIIWFRKRGKANIASTK